MLAVAPAAASAQAPGQQIPVPGPILTKLGSTPMIELWDGGGGLPYLGAPTSYNAGDWENALRTYHDRASMTSRSRRSTTWPGCGSRAPAHAGNAHFKFKRRGARGVKLVRTARRHGRGHGKPAIVFDVDETLLSNYSAIDKDNFTFGPHSQAEATDEIGTAIAPSLALYRLRPEPRHRDFLITGRRENTRAHTASNLDARGLHGLQRAGPQAGRLHRQHRRLQVGRARGDRGSGLQDPRERRRPVLRPRRRPRGRRVQAAQPVLLPAVAAHGPRLSRGAGRIRVSSGASRRTPAP